jgi:hypothetical protein
MHATVVCSGVSGVDACAVVQQQHRQLLMLERATISVVAAPAWRY